MEIHRKIHLNLLILDCIYYFESLRFFFKNLEYMDRELPTLAKDLNENAEPQNAVSSTDIELPK
jgi:hypothetical protein